MSMIALDINLLYPFPVVFCLLFIVFKLAKPKQNPFRNKLFWITCTGLMLCMAAAIVWAIQRALGGAQ